MSEIDSLLQTVMFTIYGNQYESREEHLLLTMFQVRPLLYVCFHEVTMLICSLVRPNLSIRYHGRILVAVARQHTCLSNDDDIH